jgi:hypothetical protein
MLQKRSVESATINPTTTTASFRRECEEIFIHVVFQVDNQEDLWAKIFAKIKDPQ